jgi:hypothetical protein
MKTIKVSQRPKAVNALLKHARRENVILRSDDGQEFILAEIDDFNREDELTRQNRSLANLLEARAKQTQSFSLAEAKRRLGINKQR